jgi:hypothetical protein
MNKRSARALMRYRDAQKPTIRVPLFCFCPTINLDATQFMIDSCLDIVNDSNKQSAIGALVCAKRSALGNALLVASQHVNGI